MASSEQPDNTPVDLQAAYEGAEVQEVLDQLDRELIGLQPVKTRIREIAALLVVDRARKQVGLSTTAPSLHMSFTGRPGTGKTTVAARMSQILHKLGYVRKGHVVTATRDDLVGQYIGHTAPKTREMLKKAMGGVLFIDEAYYLYRPENERDYGAEAIEILLQVMENNRDDLVVIFAGYKERMDVFYQSNPGRMPCRSAWPWTKTRNASPSCANGRTAPSWCSTSAACRPRNCYPWSPPGCRAR